MTWTNITKQINEFDTQYLEIGDGFRLVIGDGYHLKIQSGGDLWSNIAKNTSSWSNITKN